MVRFAAVALMLCTNGGSRGKPLVAQLAAMNVRILGPNSPLSSPP